MRKDLFFSFRFLLSRKINLLLMILISVCLGCLMLVDSIAHGFSVTITERSKSILADITIDVSDITLGISDIEKLENILSHIDGIEASAPYVQGSVFFKDSIGIDRGGMLLGIDPEKEKNVTQLLEKKSKDSLPLEKCFERNLAKGALIGDTRQDMIGSLSFLPGDVVTLYSSDGPMLIEVNGSFQTGLVNYDTNSFLVSLETAQTLFGANNHPPEKYKKMASGFRVKVKHGYDIDGVIVAIVESLRPLAGDPHWNNGFVRVRSFKDVNAIDIKAMESYEKIIFLILSCMVMMISFSIFVPVHSMVHDRRKDIGILKALGISNGRIFKIFLMIGILLGLSSTFIGVPFGLLMMKFLNPLLQTLDIEIFSPEIFYVGKELPVHFHFNGVMLIAIFINIVAVFASVFPSYQATRLKPIDTIVSR